MSRFKPSTGVRTGAGGGCISEGTEREGKEDTGHKGEAGGSWGGRMLSGRAQSEVQACWEGLASGR